MPMAYFGARYHSCVNHVDVKTPDQRLARGVPVLTREKSTPSMMKHLELRSSENCLASGRAFRTRMIALELVFNAEDCFHDLSCLIFDFYWFCSIIVSDIVPSWEVVCFHCLHIHWCLYCLDNNFNWAYTADTIGWILPHFWWYFWFFEACFTISASFCAVSVGHELCKTTAVTFIFRFSSAIVHFIKPNLSGGPQVSAKPIVMSAFYADAIRC